MLFVVPQLTHAWGRETFGVRWQAQLCEGFNGRWDLLVEKCDDVQSAGIHGLKLPRQLKMVFLPLLARAGICCEHLHLQYYFSPIVFCTEKLKDMGSFGIDESTGDGLSLNPTWVSMCKVTSPCKSSCRSLAQRVTDGPLLTLNFPSFFAFPGLS